MVKMGFSDKWIKWIMQCVETIDYSVIVNGNSAGPIISGRGLRQGDPLYHICFLFGVTIHRSPYVATFHCTPLCGICLVDEREMN